MANSTGMAFNNCSMIRRDSRVEDFIQCRTTMSFFLNIDPRDGGVGGWLFMSSQDAFCTWNVETTQDRVTVTTARRTGPASWSRVYITSGAKVSVFCDHISSLEIDQDKGIVVGPNPNPSVRCWFVPYAEEEAFETFTNTIGNNPWDTFPSIAGGAIQDLGYPVRLTRALYVSLRGTVALNLGVDFLPYSQVQVVDQGGIWVDGWTSVSLSNPGPGAVNVITSWANTPISLINP